MQIQHFHRSFIFNSKVVKVLVESRFDFKEEEGEFKCHRSSSSSSSSFLLLLLLETN